MEKQTKVILIAGLAGVGLLWWWSRRGGQTAPAPIIFMPSTAQLPDVAQPIAKSTPIFAPSPSIPVATAPAATPPATTQGWSPLLALFAKQQS